MLSPEQMRNGSWIGNFFRWIVLLPIALYVFYALIVASALHSFDVARYGQQHDLLPIDIYVGSSTVYSHALLHDGLHRGRLRRPLRESLGSVGAPSARSRARSGSVGLEDSRDERTVEEEREEEPITRRPAGDRCSGKGDQKQTAPGGPMKGKEQKPPW